LSASVCMVDCVGRGCVGGVLYIPYVKASPSTTNVVAISNVDFRMACSIGA
jgi:hypothetical protein